MCPYSGQSTCSLTLSVDLCFPGSTSDICLAWSRYQLTPYLEPAANMVYSKNIFANLTTTGADTINGTTPPPPPAGQPPPPPSPAAVLDSK